MTVDVQLLIDGTTVPIDERVDVVNPAHPEEVVGTAALGQAEHAERAVAAAVAAFPGWSATPIEESYQQLWNQLDVFGIGGPYTELKKRETAAQELAAKARMQQATNEKQPTEASLALASAQGNKDAEAALKRLDQSKLASKPPKDTSGRDTARSDKSYQYSSGQLDKVGQPIEQAIQRFGRLKDTLNQATPQADALVAPELLTVMAGGAGSGLRMNEAEISRIVGGRSNFESLKAALNKWQLDPSKALSITASQRGQIRQLMDEVHGKLLKKQEVLDQARQDLVNNDDPFQHRMIVSKARQSLTKIDMGQGGGGISVTDPKGGVHTFPDQASADKFKKLAGIQ